MLRLGSQILEDWLIALVERIGPSAVADKLRKPDGRRFVRFLIIGGVNTLVGYSLFCALLYAGLHYALAGLISTVLGVIFNFFTTGGIVFDNRDPLLLFRFSLGYVFIYGIGVGEMRVADVLGWNLYLVSGLLLLPNALFSYLLNKKFVFPSKARPRLSRSS